MPTRSSARIMLAAMLSVFVIVPVVQAQWQPWVVRGLIGWAEREAARRAALAAAAEAAAGAEARALAIAAAERAAAQRAAVAAANAERLAVQRATAAATAEREAARQAALAAVTAEGATTLRASASTWRSISMSPNRGLFGWRANALRAEQNAQMAITQSRLGVAAGAAQGTARGSMLMGQQTFLRRAASNMLPGRARDELGMSIYMAERRAAQAFTQGRALQTRRLFLQRQRLFSRMRQQRQLLARQAARQEATEIAAIEERQAIRSGGGSRGGSSGGPGEPGGGGSGNGPGKPSLTETFNKVSPRPYQIARDGGRHAGMLRNYELRPTIEIDRGIRSYEAQISEHVDKIANPTKYIEDFDQLDVRKKMDLIKNKWPSDIKRLREELDVLKGIREERGN